jgi:hypothetical protein
MPSKPALAAAPDSPPAPKARAPKAKLYDVYVLTDVGRAAPSLELLAAEVSSVLPRDAAARKDAIRTATAGLAEDEQYGTFATVKTGEMVTLTRGRKVEPQDVWS